MLGNSSQVYFKEIHLPDIQQLKHIAMKYFKVFIGLWVIISLCSCQKTDYSENEPNVEKYIEALKTNLYDSLNLPNFSYREIPTLLKYINETQTISTFPRNPISSYYQSECKLGMYVLWTIESIRAVSIESESLILNFPSQNPILSNRNNDELELIYNTESHEKVAKAYSDWWNENKNKDFTKFNIIDPLKDTDYKWH